MALDVQLSAIRARLSNRAHVRYEGEINRRAAIAAVLRERPQSPELLLIRRAERAGDPWSGHMALPGGHHDPGDADLLATVRRETLEEVGLNLDTHELLGPLDEHGASAQGIFTGLLLAPFVFALRHDVELRPNYEVAEVIWAPLVPMMTGARDVFMDFERDGQSMRFPGFSVGDHIVWGLTHRVLQGFFSLLR